MDKSLSQEELDLANKQFHEELKGIQGIPTIQQLEAVLNVKYLIDQIRSESFIAGCDHGYSVAQSRIKELEKELESVTNCLRGKR